MSKSTAWDNALLLLVLNNVDATNIGDAGGLRGSATPGDLYVALHTANPGVGGNQTSSEATYTGYNRMAVSRNGGAGWTVSGSQGSNAAQIQFPTATAGTETLTYVSVGTQPSGAGEILYFGPMTAPVDITAGITPIAAIGGLVITEA